MKKIIILIILLSVSIIHAQTDDKETLKKISQNIAASYKNQKFDEALKLARQAVDLSIKIYGAEDLETAAAYTNLGIIYREKEVYTESIENLRKATSIYQKNSKTKVEELVVAFEILAFSQTLGGAREDAEANYLQAIKIAEDEKGIESKESFSPALNLANYYVSENKFDKADEMYLKSYAIVIKNFGREAKEIERIENERSCFVSRKNSDPSKLKLFYEERTKRFGEFIEQGGSITSKAKSLPKPKYPAEIRNSRNGGSSLVRVRVDEKGNVIEVKSICGHPLLVKVSEEAAKDARFEKLNVNGNPVKYGGIVFYYYIP